MIPSKPANEQQRLATLRGYEILDTEPEAAFDDLTLIASCVCQTPIALISLVDADRQWFKSSVGFSVKETSRDIAFCAHAIMQHDLFIVPDASKDKRFTDNPLVSAEPKIRFYAGAPLVSPNHHALGTLCVLDRVPRQLTNAQIEALRTLSRAVMTQLEMRRRLHELEQTLSPPRRLDRPQKRSGGPPHPADRANVSEQIGALRAELSSLKQELAAARADFESTAQQLRSDLADLNRQLGN